MSIFPIETDLE